MAYTLKFEHLIEYDSGLLGITLPISLELNGKTVEILTKVDSGSSECVFARNIAEQLGIDLESGQVIHISTATGTFKTYRHPVTLTLNDYEFDVYVYFADDEFFNRNVLGRHGFLDRLVLGLVDYESKLYLNRYDYFDFE